MTQLPEVPEVDAREAQARLENGALLVDVREPHEYAEARIPGSLLVPLGKLQSRLDELPQDRSLVMQCRSGARSARATEYLLEQGYREVVNLAGGIQAWERAELPVERG